MQGRDMTMWIDRNMPHTPYDRLIGTQYVMHRLHGEDLSVGRFTNPANNTYAGYMMRKDTFRGQGSYAVNGNILPGEYGLHFRIRGLVSNSGYIDAHRMSWQADVATGTSYWDSGRARGDVIMSKVSDRCQ